MEAWDYVIIGGGISGLYTAWKLEKKYKDLSILILEEKRVLGGRTRMEWFHSKKVVTGAGVGRRAKDRLLQSLVEQSAPGPLRTFTSHIHYTFPPVDMAFYLDALKRQKQWIRTHRSSQTFRQFFLSFFSPREYQAFCDTNGYTDFENADIVDTLYDYGFDDNTSGQEFFRVDWNHLVLFLKRQLRHTEIRLRTRFTSFVRRPDGGLEIHAVDREATPRVWHAKTIIFAGTTSLYPYPIVRQQVATQPFLRMYVYHPRRQKPRTVYQHNALQKSMGISSTITMVSYSDNKNAERVMTLSDDQIEKLAGFQYDDSVRFFWKAGTHYYRPLDTERFPTRDNFIEYAQNPEPRVYLVGECISKNQGWTEGALESVERLLDRW